MKSNTTEVRFKLKKTHNASTGVVTFKFEIGDSFIICLQILCHLKFNHKKMKLILDKEANIDLVFVIKNVFGTYDKLFYVQQITCHNEQSQIKNISKELQEQETLGIVVVYSQGVPYNSILRQNI